MRGFRMAIGIVALVFGLTALLMLLVWVSIPLGPVWGSVVIFGTLGVALVAALTWAFNTF